MVTGRIRKNTAWLVTGLALLCSQAAIAKVSAVLDRDRIHIDETVRLLIQTDDINNNSQPDLSPLEQNFTLLGTSVNQNISITNGHQVVEKKWITKLEPKAAGSFTMPAIQVGGETTRPLRLTVLPENPAAPSVGRDIIVELDIAPSMVYVQQQITVTVRLFLGVNLLDGSTVC